MFAPVTITATMADGLRRLAEAHSLATAAHQDPWQWAIRGHDLADYGLTLAELRGMVADEWVDSMIEDSPGPRGKRNFIRMKHRPPCLDCCYVILHRGLDMIDDDCDALMVEAGPR